MEMIIYWTLFAEDKLEDIFIHYKFKAGTNVAKKLVNGIIDATIRLERNPYIGQVEDLLSKRVQRISVLGI